MSPQHLAEWFGTTRDAKFPLAAYWSNFQRTRRQDRAAHRAARRTNSCADRRTRRHLSLLAASFLSTGGFSQLLAGFDVLFRHFLPHRFEMRVGVENRTSTGTGVEQNYPTNKVRETTFHVAAVPF